MREYTNQLLKQFKGGDYKDFLAYVYSTFENQINTKKKKDKYLVTRNRLLQYIVSNEKTIKADLCKKWNPFHNF